MMGLMSACSAPPQTPTQRWSIEEIKRSITCQICNAAELNNWASCTRRASLLNLHPGFLSRPRQMWFIAMQTLKFTPTNREYRGPTHKFQGNVPYGAIVVTDQSVNPHIPAEFHNVRIILYGK